MNLVRIIRRHWLARRGMRVALELAAVHREYQTRVALHGNFAYIYADVLAKLAGRVEALTLELELINDMKRKA